MYMYIYIYVYIFKVMNEGDVLGLKTSVRAGFILKHGGIDTTKTPNSEGSLCPFQREAGESMLASMGNAGQCLQFV